MIITWALAACWLGPREVQSRIDDRFDTGTLDTDATCRIESISPAAGTTAGGTIVTLEVEGLTATPTVNFGNEIAEVIGVDGNKVVVQTPAVNREGPKTVLVQDPHVVCQEPNGFTYYLDGEGEFGAIGEFSWLVLQGDYWEDGSEPTGWANVTLAAPSNYRSRYLRGDALGECHSGWSADTDALVRYQGEGALLLKSSETGLELPWDAQRGAYVGDVEPGRFAYEEVYDLIADAPAGDLPAFACEACVLTPKPIQILEPDVDGADLGLIARDDFTVSWDHPGNGDYVVILVVRYVDTVLAETVTCLASDTGSFTVPPDAWVGWELLGQHVVINVARVLEPDGKLSYDRSESDILGMAWTAGAAYTL